MNFTLLVNLKTRLFLRSFSRRRSVGGILGLVALGLAFTPVWLGAAAAAYGAVVAYGAPAVTVVFATVQVSWLYVALILGAFTEAFDLRRMLRYPVDPRTVYLLNVLATPFDLVAVVLLPPLLAVVAAAGSLGGWSAALGAAGGMILLLLVTSALLQMLLGLLADLLKHEWARAGGGLLLGFAILGVAFALRGPMLAADLHAARGQSAILATLETLTLQTASVAVYLVTASLPAGFVSAVIEGRIRDALGLGAASAALAYVLVRLGAGGAARAALDRETRAVAAASSAPDARPGMAARLLDAILAPDLAVMVGRDFRTFVRTPQIIMGLLTTPLIIGLFFAAPSQLVPASAYWAAFLTLMPALNLSANLFGLDREGIRTLLVLPIPPQRLMLAKNLTIVLLIAAEAMVSGLLLGLVGPRVPGIEALTALVGVFAVLPALLAVGNVLSIRSPWRMTFKVGGAPKGAIASALAQTAVLGGMAGMLALPIAGSRLYWGNSPLVPLCGIAVEGAIAWLVWLLLLDGAGESLRRRREGMIDSLARAEETG